MARVVGGKGSNALLSLLCGGGTLLGGEVPDAAVVDVLGRAPRWA